jgi:hypothetical protein
MRQLQSIPLLLNIPIYCAVDGFDSRKLDPIHAMNFASIYLAVDSPEGELLSAIHISLVSKTAKLDYSSEIS